MRMGNKLLGFFFLIFVLPLSAAERLPDLEQATLTMQVKGIDKHTPNHCSKSLQNCTILVTQSTGGCLSQPGSISITNNSLVTAMNIRASSIDANFNTYIVQNNGCPTALAPGATCTISFVTNAAVAFTVSNVVVKGTNTNSTLFNIQAFQCVASLSASPTNISTTIGSTSIITVTNNGNANALNVQATPASPITVQSTDCGATLAPGASCHITIYPTGATTTQSVPIKGTNTNTANVLVTVLGATPGAPIHLTSVAQNGQAILSWNTPTNTGDEPITSYTITPFVGTVAQPAITVPSSSTSANITGLINGVTYTFMVVANNASGAGVPAYTNFVTPGTGLVVNPSTLALSGLGGGASRIITVTNNNLVSVNVATAGPAPALPGAASVTANGCNTNLAAGASCTVTIDPGASATSSECDIVYTQCWTFSNSRY
jgi:hypothetical protein